MTLLAVFRITANFLSLQAVVKPHTKDYQVIEVAEQTLNCCCVKGESL